MLLLVLVVVAWDVVGPPAGARGVLDLLPAVALGGLRREGMVVGWPVRMPLLPAGGGFLLVSPGEELTPPAAARAVSCN